MVSSVISTLNVICTNTITEFQKLFLEARSLGRKLRGDDFGIVRPRPTGRMTHRDSPSTSTAEEYYRIAMYNDFLSHVDSKLQERFTKNSAHNTAVRLLYLLP